MTKRLLLVFTLLLFLGCASTPVIRNGPYEIKREEGNRFTCIAGICRDRGEDNTCDKDGR